jgi:hypothetical protein
MGCDDANWTEMNYGGIQWQLSYFLFLQDRILENRSPYTYKA